MSKTRFYVLSGPIVAVNSRRLVKTKKDADTIAKELAQFEKEVLAVETPSVQAEKTEALTVEEWVTVIATALEDICARNKDVKYTMRIYDAAKLPTIKISEYLARLVKYAGDRNNNDPKLAIIQHDLRAMIYYLDKYLKDTQDQGLYVLTYSNVHRLMSTALRVALKFSQDKPWDNAHYAKVSGMEKAELNALEIDFLLEVNFDLFVKEDVLLAWGDNWRLNYNDLLMRSRYKLPDPMPQSSQGGEEKKELVQSATSSSSTSSSHALGNLPNSTQLTFFRELVNKSPSTTLNSQSVSQTKKLHP